MQQDEDRQLAHVRDELVREFGSRLSEGVVDRHFQDLVREFDHAPIRQFVPVIAQRVARERLQGLARA